MDVGLLLLRVVVGALLVGHGTQKLFGWFDGHGPDKTGQFLESLDYKPGRQKAILAGASEAAAGALLVLGLFTPLASAALIGVMVNAIGSVHGPRGPWATNGGYEYPLVLAAAAACLAFTGAGVVSLDTFIGLENGGYVWGILALAVGLGSGFSMLGARDIEEEEIEVEVRGEAETETISIPDDERETHDAAR